MEYTILLRKNYSNYNIPELDQVYLCRKINLHALPRIGEHIEYYRPGQSTPEYIEMVERILHLEGFPFVWIYCHTEVVSGPSRLTTFGCEEDRARIISEHIFAGWVECDVNGNVEGEED